MRSTSRRRFLKNVLSTVPCLGRPVAHVWGRSASIVQSERVRPQAHPGLQIGDVLVDRGIVWCRTDRPARLLVERSYRADFGDATRIRGPVATEAHDFVARVDLEDLAPDRTVFVRALFEEPAGGRTRSAPLEGRFRTAPTTRRNIRFLWSGDTAGQGFGINPDWGGMRTYEAMRQTQPDFFIHCGDTIYADGPIAPAVPLADGGVWRNVVTQETSKVAEALDEFRGRYRYNLLDAHVQRFSAEVPQIWLWDDHEVLNNWSAATDLSQDPRYTEKDVRRLAARGRQAFLEYAPMRHRGVGTTRIDRRAPYGPLLDVLLLDERSYRAANSYNRQPHAGRETAFMGSGQITWIKRALRESTALWKVIASDMPIGLLVPDARDAGRRQTFDGVANGNGPALGRELELADLLRFIKRERIRNVVWITADVHYTAAHHYDPARARFEDFDPFWEFVSGPLNAGTFGPGELDDTFGPRVVFQKGSPTPNAPPSSGLQFFGQVDIDGRAGEMVVTLKDVEGRNLFAQRLAPVSRSS